MDSDDRRRSLVEAGIAITSELSLDAVLQTLVRIAAGLTAARYEGKDGKGYLQQVYERDTGEKMWDISAPVIVKGRHWGAFRIGYQMD